MAENIVACMEFSVFFSEFVHYKRHDHQSNWYEIVCDWSAKKTSNKDPREEWHRKVEQTETIEIELQNEIQKMSHNKIL